MLKPRFAAAANTYTSDFPDVKFRIIALKRNIGESNPVPASGQKFRSGSKVNQLVYVLTFVDTPNIHARVIQ